MHRFLRWTYEFTFSPTLMQLNSIHAQTKEHGQGRTTSPDIPPAAGVIHSNFVQSFLPYNPTSYLPAPDQNANSFLICAMARPGFKPFGHVRVQFRIVWHRYKLMELSRAALRSAFLSSRESAIQRYD